jgi:nucleotide-binding universal stress UspA family protein
MFGERPQVMPTVQEGTGRAGARAILVGVDGSRTSMRAVAYAAGMAQRQLSCLVLVHVRPPGVAGGLDPYLTGWVAALRDDEVDELWNQVAEQVPIGTVAGQLITVTGDPFLQLSRVAAECGAEVVVVGASEQFRHHFLGALGTRLVRTRRWPVVVVP